MIGYQIIAVNEDRAAICVQPDGFSPMWIDLPIDENGAVPTGAELDLYISGFLPIGEVERQQKVANGITGLDKIKVVPILNPSEFEPLRRDDEVAIVTSGYKKVPMALIAEILQTEVPGASFAPVVRVTDNAPVAILISGFAVPPDMAPAAALLGLKRFIDNSHARGVPVIGYVNDDNLEFRAFSATTLGNKEHVPSWEKGYVIVYKDYDLDFARALKNSELNVAREQANQSFFVFNGKRIECDKLSRSDIDAIASYIGMNGTLPPTFPMMWKTMDNEIIPMQDVDTFSAMYSAMVAQGTTNFMRAQQLKQQLAVAATFEEIEEVQW